MHAAHRYRVSEEAVRLAAQEAGQSLTDVATAAGVCRATLYQWFDGKSPTATRVAAVADALGVPLDLLLIQEKQP